LITHTLRGPHQPQARRSISTIQNELHTALVHLHASHSALKGHISVINKDTILVE